MSRLLARLKIRWGIASVLTLSMVVVIALLMATTTILDIRRERAAFRDQLKERALLMASTLNDVLAAPIYFTDVEQLLDIEKVVTSQPDVLYLQVFSPDGTLLVDIEQNNTRYPPGWVGDELGLSAVQSGEIMLRSHDQIMEVAAPVQIGTEIIGGVKFGFSSDSVNARISSLTVQRIWQFWLLTLIGVVISYLIAHYLVRPIKRLVLATQRVAEGELDFSTHDHDNRSDELGDLVVAFEDMTGALRVSRAKLEERSTELRTVNERLLVEVAERKRAEEALQKARDELELRVEDRTAELSWTNQSLTEEIAERKKLQEQLIQSQKMESIGRLAGGVAHDFNNLLTPIMGYAQLALIKLPSGQDHLRTNLQEIEKAAERASKLTHQLLAFSRGQVIEPKVFNLNNLILDMDKMLRRLIGEDIELVTLPTPDLELVKVDPGQMEQVLVNLAVNARDAMPNGGKLMIQTENVTLGQDSVAQHPGATGGEYVMLAVGDNGVGMSEEVKANAFEPFFTTKEVGKGTGLGLSTCYGIVAQSGGHITVDSEPGQGTTVKTYLPRVQQEGASLPSREVSASLPLGSETVLLVEDEPTVRGMAAHLLREQGLYSAGGSQRDRSHAHGPGVRRWGDRPLADRRGNAPDGWTRAGRASQGNTP